MNVSRLGTLVLAVWGAWVSAALADTVRESARSIPVAYDVDVVVVGGTTGGVAAAVGAAEGGADVFLAAQRPYLGQDVCGAYRLWLEPGEEPSTPLAGAMFAEPPALVEVGRGVPFSYETDIPAGGRHPDTAKPSKLSDGKWASAYTQSVEYGGDVTITIDLKKDVALGEIHVMAFQRRRDIETAMVTVAISKDKARWRYAARINNTELRQGDYIDAPLCLSAPLKGKARYLKVVAKKSGKVERQLLGEVVIEPAGADSRPQRVGKPRVPPMPMQVKRALDQALLNRGVQFLYGCYATDVLRDANGYLAGVVMANRSGRQAVKARVIIDATPRADVARIAGVPFAAYPGGEQTFRRVVIGGEVHQGAGAVARRIPASVHLERRGSATAACRTAIAYTLDIPMQDGSFASFARAEQIARDRTWDRGQVDASEVLYQVPPDPMKGAKHLSGEWPGADKADLDAFRPSQEQRLYVVGGCADVSRKAAGQLARPLALMTLGRRIGRAAAADANVTPRPRVVCLGDSITAAGYPAKLGRKLDGYHVINAGAGGDTSGQGLARLDRDVLGHAPKAVVVLFGTNDSVLTGPGRFKTPVKEYESNLRAIVQRCVGRGATVVVCTLPPVIAERYFERHPKAHYDAEGGLEKVLLRYRDAALRVAESLGVPGLDLYRALDSDLSTFGACGVHPTPKGEETIASLVAEKLRPLLPPRKREKLALSGVRVAGVKGKASAGGQVRETLVGVRPTQRGLPTVPAGERVLPVLGDYDVVVVGGGTGGAPAGIGAARQGAKTLVLEYLNGLGGVGTLGLIGKYYWGYRHGFTAEIDRGVADLGGQKEPATLGWNVEWKMEWYRREVRKAGADIWFGTLGCGALVEDGCVKGVVVATPQGRGVVLAKVVIDSTGNSDIAAAAGAQCIYTDGSHVAVQGTGMPPRKPGASYTNTDYTLTDDADIVDMWRTYVVAREKYKQAYDLGQIIDTRERRRIVGDFVISPLDLYNGRTYLDTVGVSYSNFDTHGFTVHPLFSLNPPNKKGVQAYTPYRALLPKGLDGILVTGLGISAHRDAMPVLRMQPDIQNQGYAAGVAAAMAARSGKTTRQIDIRALQKHLIEKGSLPKSVLTDRDTFPLPQEKIAAAVASVVDGQKGLGLILAQPRDAMPLLRKAHAAAKTDEARLVYAHILGMMGDATGVACLIKSVRASDWDAGWSFKGGGQFGASLSPLDSRIIALGKTRDRRAVAPILEKVMRLGPKQAFSHHRAVAVALETLGDTRAAVPLAGLLMKPGMTGYALGTIEDAKRSAEHADANRSRDVSLRELILARALYRCGDSKGIGEKILREYAKDFRGHHARHAQAVLKGGGQ